MPTQYTKIVVVEHRRDLLEFTPTRSTREVPMTHAETVAHLAGLATGCPDAKRRRTARQELEALAKDSITAQRALAKVRAIMSPKKGS